MALLHELVAEACVYQAGALAANTRRQYGYQVKWWAMFCIYTGIDFQEPPEMAVCAYAALLARSVAATSVRQYVKGLKDFYLERGYTQFADPLRWRRLFKTFKGIDRAKKVGVNKKVPITPAMLLALREYLNLHDPAHVAIFALALVAFFGYFRKSNLAVGSASLWSDGKCLRFGDIRVDSQVHALAIKAPGSKTRQSSAAPVIWVKGLPGHPLCPVAAWTAHVAASGVPADDAVTAFSYRVLEQRVPMHHKDVDSVAKVMARLAGIDESAAASHSFRRGGATWALQSGVAEVLVQRQGDWRSAAYKEYIELSRAQALSTTARMLAAMPVEDVTWQHAGMTAAVAPDEHVVTGMAVPPPGPV